MAQSAITQLPADRRQLAEGTRHHRSTRRRGETETRREEIRGKKTED